MPRKLENGQYEFKGGCIGEKGKNGKYKVVAARKRKKKVVKRKKNSETNEETKVEHKVEKIETKKRRSQKKQFSKPTQKGGDNSNLNITVHMLREFYSNNL